MSTAPRTHNYLFLLAFSITWASCGQIKLGHLASPAEGVPPGTSVSSGPFTSLNGKEVSGIAAIYRKTAPSPTPASPVQFVVRLEGITAPTEAGQQVIAIANGKEVLSVALRGSSGTMNETVPTPLAGDTVWNSVSIRSARAGRPEYGKAILRAN